MPLVQVWIGYPINLISNEKNYSIQYFPNFEV